MKSLLLPLGLVALIGAVAPSGSPAQTKTPAPAEKAQKAKKAGPTDETPAPGPAPDAAKPRKVEFSAPDGLVITGDLYADADKTRPVVLLCHQARSSRGEYRAIAPRLVRAGFNCLAIDQRSGRGLPDVSKGVKNETAARAEAQGKSTGYAAAEQDIVAATLWIRKQGHTGRITLWGSSYSAALAFFVGLNAKDVDAVIAFSPGEYLGSRGSVAGAASRLHKPVLIVSPQSEKRQADAIFAAIASKQRTLCIDPHNLHGSRTLFMAEDSRPAWDAVLNFLRRHGRGVRSRSK